MRDIRVIPVTERSALDQPMTLIASDVSAAGGIDSSTSLGASGATLVVEHTADNNLVTFRFENAGVAMLAAEEDFEISVNGSRRKMRAGALIIEQADAAALGPQLAALGLSGFVVAEKPAVKIARARCATHRLCP